jgi:hypothetical protein
MKPTREERIEAKEIIQWLIANHCIHDTDIAAGVKLALSAESVQLEKERAALLSPAPTNPRSPRANRKRLPRRQRTRVAANRLRGTKSTPTT